ncbi:MAG TPA: DMT family transporter [Chthoniobacterales bacterium]
MPSPRRLAFIVAGASRPFRELSPEREGLILGLLGVLCFSLTAPATRAAVAGGLDPLLVGAGRSFGAALLAAPLLWLTRQARPRREHVGSLAGVIAGVILGFPLLLTWALRRVPATHAGAVVGLLPLATAVVGTLRGRERPSVLFWLAGAAGSGVVAAFALGQGHGRLATADLALFGAIAAAAVGYTEGALISRTLGGWQTISWALVLASPLTGALMVLSLQKPGGTSWTALAAVPWSGWLGFGYVMLFSQFLGFFVWYRGLALGGVARVGQLQLLMPFLTIMAAGWFLGERITPATVGAAAAVFATVAVGRKAAVHTAPRPRPPVPQARVMEGVGEPCHARRQMPP